jgi:hypothetical protein
MRILTAGELAAERLQEVEAAFRSLAQHAATMSARGSTPGYREGLVTSMRALLRQVELTGGDRRVSANLKARIEQWLAQFSRGA